MTAPVLAIGAIGLAGLAAILGTAWAVLYQLVKQNGRIIARLDALEHRLEGGGDHSARSRLERGGLKAGTPAPQFELPEIGGGTVSLATFRGRRVLLVFSDPECGPCNEFAAQLVQLHRRHTGNGLAVLMIGRGDPAENRRKAIEHGFEFPVALQRRWETSKEYGIFATPVAFLIGDDGVIERGVATGADEILALAD